LLPEGGNIALPTGKQENRKTGKRHQPTHTLAVSRSSPLLLAQDYFDIYVTAMDLSELIT